MSTVKSFCLALLVLSFLSSNAADSSGTAPQTQLNFAGKLADGPLFSLEIFNNQKLERFIVSVRDSNGYLLYREEIKQENYRKLFLFDSGELGRQKINVEVFNYSTRQKTIYEIDELLVR